MTPPQEAILALRERTYGCGTCRTCIEHLQTAALIEKLAIDAERYCTVRSMLLIGTLSIHLQQYKWPSGSDKNVNLNEFNAAIDAARNK